MAVLTGIAMLVGTIAVSAADGGLVQAQRFGGTDADLGLSVAVDGAGNSDIAGSFKGTADFDPGPGTLDLASAGGADIYVAKPTPAGDLT